MRALAHPVRLAMLELLHEHGTATATECGAEVGESPQSCSYHLRTLAKWGLIRTVESEDGRETRWELAARGIKFATGGGGAPGAGAAVAALKASVLDHDARQVENYLAHEHELPAEWQEAATFATGIVYVTAEELEELSRRVHEISKEFERRAKRDRPEGSRSVHVMFRAIPKVGDG